MKIYCNNLLSLSSEELTSEQYFKSLLEDTELNPFYNDTNYDADAEVTINLDESKHGDSGNEATNRKIDELFIIADPSLPSELTCREYLNEISSRLSRLSRDRMFVSSDGSEYEVIASDDSSIDEIPDGIVTSRPKRNTYRTHQERRTYTKHSKRQMPLPISPCPIDIPSKSPSPFEIPILSSSHASFVNSGGKETRARKISSESSNFIRMGLDCFSAERDEEMSQSFLNDIAIDIDFDLSEAKS